MSFHYVRRFKNGVEMRTIDIPTKDLAETLKNHPDWVDLGEINLTKITVPDLKIGVTECPICGFVAKNDTGLKVHKQKHYV